MPRSLHAVILAGGEGKRMGPGTTKVLVDLLGRPLIGHVLDALVPIATRRAVVVGGRHLPAIRAALTDEAMDLRYVRQSKPLGTAHAAKQALPELPKRNADVLILCGDVPLLSADSLERAVALHREDKAEVTVVTAHVSDPTGLGRIVRDDAGRFTRIVEEKDASESERAITEINAGSYVVRAEALHRLIPKIGRNNAQREYYLTDLVSLSAGKASASPLEDPEEARGINRPAELDEARALMKARIVAELRSTGVRVDAPEHLHIERGVEVGPGTVLHPFVVLRRGAKVGARCSVGPFAHLRSGTVLGDEATMGAFVEATRTEMGEGATALHHAYLGDAVIGAGTNVGAGTITANSDGVSKHVTVVGDGVRLGAGTVLVAPVRVGEGAVTGAGSVLTADRDVAPGETVVGVPARTHEAAPAAAKTTRRRKAAKKAPRRGAGGTD